MEIVKDSLHTVGVSFRSHAASCISRMTCIKLESSELRLKEQPKRKDGLDNYDRTRFTDIFHAIGRWTPVERH